MSQRQRAPCALYASPSGCSLTFTSCGTYSAQSIVRCSAVATLRRRSVCPLILQTVTSGRAGWVTRGMALPLCWCTSLLSSRTSQASFCGQDYWETRSAVSEQCAACSTCARVMANSKCAVALCRKRYRHRGGSSTPAASSCLGCGKLHSRLAWSVRCK